MEPRRDNGAGEILRKRLAHFEDVCREKGLKLTHQRREIFRDVAEDTTHPSAEDVYKRLKRRLPALSLDTVYRTLATFEQLGLIQRVQLLENIGRYDSNVSTHHHIECRRCQSIRDFDWPEFDALDASFAAEGWGKVTGKRVEVWGVCDQCQSPVGGESG